jgi:hypothetical protein
MSLQNILGKWKLLGRVLRGRIGIELNGEASVAILASSALVLQRVVNMTVF